MSVPITFRVRYRGSEIDFASLPYREQRRVVAVRNIASEITRDPLATHRRLGNIVIGLLTVGFGLGALFALIVVGLLS